MPATGNGVEVERLVVGAGFNPEVGFLRRDDFERTFGSVRFSPRPRSIAAIRKFSWSAQIEYITDRAGVLETREAEGRFGIELENGDTYDLSYTRTYEFLEQPFPIAPGVTIPVGGYSFQDVRTSYSFGSQRRLAGRLSAQHGSFFSGEKTSVSFGLGGGGFGGGRLELTRQLSVEPGVSFNWVDLPEGSFSTGPYTLDLTSESRRSTDRDPEG